MSRQSYIFIALILAVAAAILLAPGQWGYRVLLAVLAYIAVALVVSVISITRNFRLNRLTGRSEYTVKLAAHLIGLSFTIGIGLYAYAFQVIAGLYGAEFDNLELVLRSVICSLDTFTLDIDSNILDRIDRDTLLKDLLVVQAALSFGCTVMLLVGLVFSRAKAYYMLHRRTRITQSRNHLNLFFGLDESSRLLAKDIHKKDPGAINVFIDVSVVGEDEGYSMGRIVGMLTHKQRTFDFVAGSGSLVAIASCQLCDIDEDRLAGGPADVLSMIGLGRIRDLIMSLRKYPADARLHIFFLSGSEDSNVRNLMNLAKDRTILAVADERMVEEKIYCRARYSGPNRIVEDLAVSKGLVVEIVDSAHLAVELFMSKEVNQPVRVACLSETVPATVSRPLEALVIGFGKVGRDAFRYLYEFGTFVGMDHGKPQVMYPRITAVDMRMDELDGTFLSSRPGINARYGREHLRKLDCNSIEFYMQELSEEKCRSLNYIVIALDDNDQNITLASNIFNRIRRYRDDMSHLVIMVRCLSIEKQEIMQRIADHFNHGCGPKPLHVVRLFGNPKDIYTYDIIVRDSLAGRGIMFLDNYRRLRAEAASWTERRDRLMGRSCRGSGYVYPGLDDLRWLRRHESQDQSDALHVATKAWILQQALGRDYDWDSFLERMFGPGGEPVMSGARHAIHYPRLTLQENETLLRLAMLEHARWCAAHVILGYERGTERQGCDERTMRHDRLCGWEELDRASDRASTPGRVCDYKAYDFAVVNTSVFLSKNRLGKIPLYEES